MAERNLTAEELKAEIETTERDLAQLRAQLRILEGGDGGTVEQRIWSIAQNPLPVREISLKIGASREVVGVVAAKMVAQGILTRVSPGVFQRAM